MDFPRERTGGHFHPTSLAFALLILLGAAISSAAAAKVDAPTPLSARASQADGYRQSAYVPECNPDWVAVSSPNPGTGLNVLNGVAAVSASDVWAVGYYQSSSLYQTVALHWVGSAWNVVPSPNVGSDNNYLNGVVEVLADDVSPSSSATSAVTSTAHRSRRTGCSTGTPASCRAGC